MGFDAISRSWGSLSRASAELNLFQQSEIKRVSLNGTLAPLRNQELDGAASEVEEGEQLVISKYYDLKAAEAAEDAALAGFITSIAGLGATVAGGIASKKKSDAKGDNSFSGLGFAQSLAGEVFSVAGAFVAWRGTVAERDILADQVGELSTEVQEDQDMVSALDSNPVI